jgi:hypothetical protein
VAALPCVDATAPESDPRSGGMGREISIRAVTRMTPLSFFLRTIMNPAPSPVRRNTPEFVWLAGLLIF